MALIFRDWLTSTQQLPLEGIGTLHWERRPAYWDETDLTIYPAQWELRFSADGAVRVPDTFFERLSSFSRLPVSELRQQYQAWLLSWTAADKKLDVFGFGKLVMDDRSIWNWTSEPLPALPTESLSVIPAMQSAPQRVRWETGTVLVAMLAVLAIGAIAWMANQKGFRAEMGASRIKTELTPAENQPLPYLEIR